MTTGMVAKHAAGKRLNDAIFGASAACREAIEKYGDAKVTNATIGVLMDDEGNLACMPTVEKIYKTLPFTELATYAPISGLPQYLSAATKLVFDEYKPNGYTAAVATAGGTGAIHHAIENYAERNDEVLTSDWFWGTYNVICNETGKKLTTFELFDEKLNFNLKNFSAKVDSILQKQDSLLIILNTPAHNPTGFALNEDEWDGVLGELKRHAKAGKKVNLLVDIAYIDYAGEKAETRRFMQKFDALPDNIFVMLAFSMSKGFAFYGQRTGAIIGISQSKAVIDEFAEVCKYSSRATWSNINRGAMTLLAKIYADASLRAKYEKERDGLYKIVEERAAIFMNEAATCGLTALPYTGGFFISVPTTNAKAVCEKLHEDLIYAVPLKLGVRVAACSVPAAKMRGMAAKMKAALNNVA